MMLSGNTAAALDIHPDDYRRLLARLSAQDQSIESFRRVLQDLRADVLHLRTDQESLRTQAASPRNFATLDQLTHLADQLRRVEQSRLADKQQILSAIQELKSISVRPSAADLVKGGAKAKHRTTPQKKPAGKGIPR